MKSGFSMYVCTRDEGEFLVMTFYNVSVYALFCETHVFRFGGKAVIDNWQKIKINSSIITSEWKTCVICVCRSPVKTSMKLSLFSLS